MKPLIELTNLLTNFASQKARKIEPEKRPEAVPIRLNPKHIIRKHNNLIVLLFGLSLSACTGLTYSSHFDCPMGEGAGCASLSRVNKMIDRQEIDLAEDRLPGNDNIKGVCAPQTFGSQVYVYYGPDQLSRLISADGLETPTARGPTFDREATLAQEGK